MEIEPEELVQAVPSAVGRICEDFSFVSELQSCGGYLHRGQMPLRNKVDVGREKPVNHVHVSVREYYFDETERTHIMVDVFVGFQRRQRWVPNYTKLRIFLSTLKSVLEECRATKASTLHKRLLSVGLARPR